MSVKIRFRGGPLAGKTYTFEDDQERIVIGRDPEQCDVVLPPDLTSVGREHLALRRSLARYRVVLNRENPVLLDGKPVLDDTELPEVADLQLGEDGPRLIVQTVGASTVPPTEYHGDAPQDIQDLVKDTVKRSRSNRTVALLLGLGVIALAVIIAMATSSTKRDVQSITQEQAQAIDQLTKDHRETTQALRKNFDGVNERVEEITPAISNLKETVAGLGEGMEGLEERVERMRPRMKKVLKEAAASTYVVVLREPSGVENPVATAWVVGEGRLATNAHVAEAVREVMEARGTSGPLAGKEVVVRSPGADPRDHRVTGVSTHPGYSAFIELWDEYQPTGMSPQGQLRSVRPAGVACDVALLEVEDADHLAAPLPIASQEVLEKLGPGDVAGLVGYPSEDLSLSGVNLSEPTPTSQIAHLTAVTNYFLAVAEPEDRLLVQHAIPVTGGASGSPILDQDGRVIAVLSAGNIELTPLGRAPSAVQINFAQRSDLVRELVEGKADEIQVARTVRWQQGISTLMSLRKAAERGAEGFLRRYLEVVEGDVGTGPELLEDWSETVDTAPSGGRGPAYHDRFFAIPEPGVYVFYAYGVLGQDIDLAVLHETDDSIVYARETSNDWYAAIRLSADTAARVRLRVMGPRDAEYQVYAYRFAP